MTAQESLTWFEAPACDADRAQRFYEALLDIVSGSASTSLRFPGESRADSQGAAPAPAPMPGRRA